MRVVVTVTDDDGRVFRGEADLVPTTGGKSTGRPRRNPAAKDKDASRGQQLDFDLPTRAFVKKYAGRGMSGAKRFVLLLAWLAKGKPGVDVPVKDLKRVWDTMTEPMGGKFNPAHTTRAKDKGWTDISKPGVYQLRVSWRQIFTTT